MLRRIGIIAVLSIIVAAFAAVPALAQTATFANLRYGVNLSNNTATATGSVNDLPSAFSTDVRLTLAGTATVECRAPKGGIVRVFSGVPVSRSGEQTNLQPEESLIRGWHIDGISVTTTGNITPAAKACTKKWTPIIHGDIVWTSLTVEAIQPSESNIVVARNSLPF
jgi:hypothetical protein